MDRFNAVPAKVVEKEYFAKLTDSLPYLTEEQMKELEKRIEQVKSNPIPTDEYLTINQVGEYLKVCRTTVWKYSKAGILKPRKIGGRVLFARSDIDFYMRKEASHDKH
ncbi:MAG: helix-turn-helix domain-containing protein [Prevotella sp.]|nr:helix-turn-helix domain-containing protein [Prevotella sp.]